MDAYPWPDVSDFSTTPFQEALKESPRGMQALVCSPCGILENVVGLTGYDNLCLMIHDDPLLASDLFEQVGTRILAYFRAALRIDRVGALMCNDDWGFNTQTMISPSHLRKYVFPWYRRIVKEAHDSGRYALLHSCGNSREILTDIVETMAFDGKHSFEDNIEPVEVAYEAMKGRIAVLGGIDLGFLATATPEQVAARCRSMLERAALSGGYALGSGNSIADFVPFENYQAMVDAARRLP
jgi:uroporphyrinogen decarboxylase